LTCPQVVVDKPDAQYTKATKCPNVNVEYLTASRIIALSSFNHIT